MNRLNIIILSLSLFLPFFAYSQQRQIEMEYDAAGNRKHLINATLLTQKSWDGQETLLDLSNFPPGIYILSILIGGINKEFKVVKE